MVRNMFKSIESTFIGVALSLVIFSFSMSLHCHADDPTFAPAPAAAAATTTKSPFSQAIQASAIAPASTDTQPPPQSATTHWIASFFANPAVLIILVGVLIRAENTIQAKTKLNIANGVAIAHTVFNVLRDRGVIAHGKVFDALDSFWNELDRQSMDHLGAAPNALVQDSAHATFTKLLKEQLQETPVVTKAAQAASTSNGPIILATQRGTVVP